MNNKFYSIKEMLDKTSLENKARVAYRIWQDDECQEYTYEEVYSRVKALAIALNNFRFKSKVAIIGENSMEWELAYLAIASLGLAAVPLDKLLPDNELERLLIKSEAEAIFCDEKYLNILKKIKSNKEIKIKYIICLNDNDNELNIYDLINRDYDSNEEEAYLKREIAKSTDLSIIFTSGTTSKSKGIVLSHENVCTNLNDLRESWQIDHNDIFLSVLPVHHAFECTVGFLYPLSVGATIIFSKGIRHIIEEIREYGVTIMACVPGVYDMLYKSMQKYLEKREANHNIDKYIDEYIGSSIRLFICGAASLSKTTEQGLRSYGLNIMQAYGLSETSPVVSLGTKNNYKLGTVGKAIKSVKCKIKNPSSDGIGELLVKGPSIMKGYYQDTELTKEAFDEDGYFCTGDLATIDNEGFIKICGRKKNVIVLKNGKNIYPEEMELLINSIPGVKECFIYGKKMGEDALDVKIGVKIVFDKKIMKNKYQTEDFQEIYDVLKEEVDKVNKMMPKYKAIKNIVITEEDLIKTSTNKIKRDENLITV